MWQRYNQTSHIFEKSVDNGVSWLPLPLNASIITEGTIPISTHATTHRPDGTDQIVGPIRANGQIDTLSSPASAVIDIGRWSNGEPNIWSRQGGTNAALVITGNPLKLGSGGNPVDLLSGQLRFPAGLTPSVDTNTFDCYKEGSFTPTFGGSGGQSGQVYGHNSGIYTKKGDEVHAQGSIALSTLGTITGSLRVLGLPFTSNASIARSAITIGYFSGLATAVSSISGYISASVDYVDITAILGGGSTGITGLSQGNLTAAFNIIFSANYKAAS